MCVLHSAMLLSEGVACTKPKYLPRYRNMPPCFQFEAALMSADTRTVQPADDWVAGVRLVYWALNPEPSTDSKLAMAISIFLPHTPQ